MTNYFDLLDENEELLFVPVINLETLISNYVDTLIKNEQYNFIFCDNINFDIINTITKLSDNKEIKYSVSLMKDFKIINWNGTYNYNKPFIVFHTGHNFDQDKHEMILRHFSTMSYMYSKITYVTIHKNNLSDICIYK